jgi:hypothetical protein
MYIYKVMSNLDGEIVCVEEYNSREMAELSARVYGGNTWVDAVRVII